MEQQPAMGKHAEGNFDSPLPFLIAWSGLAGRKSQTSPLHVEFAAITCFTPLQVLCPKTKGDEVVSFLWAAAHKAGTGFPFHVLPISHFCRLHLIYIFYC